MEYLTPKRLNKIKEVVKNRESGFVVVLEDIYDPHNAAAVIRTCDSFGIKDIYFIFKKQQAYDPKIVGKVSSSGANKWVDFKTFSSTENAIVKLKKLGYKVFVTTLAKSTKPLNKVNFNKRKVAIIFGNEHTGVSKTAVELGDETIMIPQNGMVQSLNISVAAAIIIYEATKQRGGKYKLDNKQQEKLLNNYKSRASKAMIKLTKLNERSRKTTI